MRVLRTALIVICLCPLTTNDALAKEWRGIEPYHSSRADVERLLGPPNFNGWLYDFPEERALITYSNGSCNVPKDVVVEVFTTPFGAQIGSAQTAGFNPEILSAKARIAYSKLAKACVFRVGGVGYGGQTSKEELALYDLLEDAHALDALRSLVKTGSYEGGLYGLVGLSIRDHREFNLAVEIYKARKERPERPETGSLECFAFNVNGETVITQSGCIIDVEQRDKIVKAIQSGRYDRRLNAKYRPRNE